MPHLAEQDHRRAVRAPAQRAGLLPPQIAPRVLVITGPSGVGKGTVIKRLLERFPGLALSVSATTRKPREGEADGRDYHFLSPEEFETRLQNDEFLEWAEYAGNRYGTLRSELERDVEGLVLEIEVQGAEQVKEKLPDAFRVFLKPPEPAALRDRLERRGSDTHDQIERRLEEASRELEAESSFNRVIVNDDLDEAVQELEREVSKLLGR